MAFGRFERMVAWRYLRPTKGEGFISVIAGFALVGIALGVGTLIVVLAVMNGFRAELLGRVLGVNGHATVVSGPAGHRRLRRLADRLPGAPGRGRRHALRRGPGDGQRQRRRRRAPWCAASGQPTSRRGTCSPATLAAGLAGGAWREPGTARDRQPDGRADGLRLGSQITLISPKGAATALGTVPRDQDLHRGRGVRGRDVRVRQQLRLHPAGRRAGLFPAARPGERGRDHGRGPGAHRQLPPRSAGTARGATPGWSTGSSSTRTSSRRCRSSAT